MAVTGAQSCVEGRKRRCHRADDFPVRQWLKLGVASAGVGAALMGFALLGPEAATATADSASESSVSGSADSDSTDAAGTADTVSATDPDDTDDTDEPDESDVEPDEEVQEEVLDEADTETETETDDVVDEPPSDDAEVIDQLDEEDGAENSDEGTVQFGALTPADTASATALDEPATQPVPAPPWLAPRRSWNDIVAGAIDSWTTSTQTWIDSLSVSEERKVELAESFRNLRRTFFNQAPTLAPVQITGLLTGSIAGTLGATDADGDEIVYRLIRGPRQGSVLINDDGTYTYTPGDDFDGVDTFGVIAIDRGFHINLLSLLRPIGTRATSLINQSAIRFDFNYTDGGTAWTEERRQALEDVANQLLWYLRVNAPVTLTYDVGLEDDESLASAGSDLTTEAAGFWRTVVQHKLLSGVDTNGAAADGEILWNWTQYDWGLGDSVADGEYDFVSTAIHELMHSFGFLSNIDAPGRNSGRDWTDFDRYIVTVDGVRPISPFYGWRSRYDEELTGADGGFYFGGANAIAAYGGLVPLFTPDPFQRGSAMSHLDDTTFTGADQRIMNAATGSGLAVRVVSPLELAILTDLGYQVVMPQTPPYAAAALGFVLLGGWRRKGNRAAR